MTTPNESSRPDETASRVHASRVWRPTLWRVATGDGRRGSADKRSHRQIQTRSHRLPGSVPFLLVLLAGTSAGRAVAQTVGVSSLSSGDFTFSMSHTSTAGVTSMLNDNGLKTFFTAARCSCPTDVIVALAISSDGVTKLGSSSLDAQIEVGSDCDNSSASGCSSVGSALTLSSSKSSTKETISSADFFSGRSCSVDSTSTRIWAIIRVDGSRLDSQPSLVITLGGSAPTTPTAVKAKTADGGLLVSWTTTVDSSTIQGHQVLCSPGVASPPASAFETCAGSTATSGDGPFATLDSQFICSDLVAVGTDSVRLRGLENGTTYQVAVVAVGNDDTPSTPSAVATATPNPTFGLDDLYRQAGGTAQTGCALVPQGDTGENATWKLALLVLAVTWVRRSRPAGRRPVLAGAMGTMVPPLVLVMFLLVSAIAGPARAVVGGATDGEISVGAEAPNGEIRLGTGAPQAHAASPREWNFELRFGPYRPDVDGEFAARGSDARPYQQLFSSSKHLLTQIEIDRHFSHVWGTWAVGFGAGYTKASAAALATDLSSQTGDDTALTVIPLSVSLVYRADQLRRYEQIGVEPYAKVGFDYAYWSISDTAKTDSIGGKTLGWHAAAGLSLDLSSLDPDASRLMDLEAGVNQTAIFFEVSRYALDGFGSGSVLHLSDTTWSTGLMLEF
jgi:hypothetical protein